MSDVAVKGVFHLLNGLTPGAFTQVTNMARGVAGEQTKYGKEMNASDEALALFAGMRINEANVNSKIAEMETAEANEKQAEIDNKASAKAKLIAGEALTEDEANTIVL